MHVVILIEVDGKPNRRSINNVAFVSIDTAQQRIFAIQHDGTQILQSLKGKKLATIYVDLEKDTSESQEQLGGCSS